MLARRQCLLYLVCANDENMWFYSHIIPKDKSHEHFKSNKLQLTTTNNSWHHQVFAKLSVKSLKVVCKTFNQATSYFLKNLGMISVWVRTTAVSNTTMRFCNKRYSPLCWAMGTLSQCPLSPQLHLQGLHSFALNYKNFPEMSYAFQICVSMVPVICTRQDSWDTSNRQYAVHVLSHLYCLLALLHCIWPDSKLTVSMSLWYKITKLEPSIGSFTQEKGKV